MQLDQWLLIIAASFLLFLFMIDVAKELNSKLKQRKADQDEKNNRAFEETFTRLREETEAKRTEIRQTFRAQPPITTQKQSTKETIYYPILQTEDYTTNQSQGESNHDGSHATDQ